MKLITDYQVAYESLDHTEPWGTKKDNNTSLGFIDEVEEYFQKKKFSFLDIGCSGGQLVIDFFERGHNAIGIEGSDYSALNGRESWSKYYNKCLFTCDASKPYKIVSNKNKPVKFDCISSWEVIEHILPEDLDAFFLNVVNHMHDKSIFVGSISYCPDKYHFSIFPEEEWKNNILSKYFIIEEYPFQHTVRNEPMSFYFKLLKKS